MNGTTHFGTKIAESQQYSIYEQLEFDGKCVVFKIVRQHNPLAAPVSSAEMFRLAMTNSVINTDDSLVLFYRDLTEGSEFAREIESYASSWNTASAIRDNVQELRGLLATTPAVGPIEQYLDNIAVIELFVDSVIKLECVNRVNEYTLMAMFNEVDGAATIIDWRVMQANSHAQ